MKAVFYHSNCYDGFGAAFVCWKKFGESAQYFPVSYGFNPPEVDSRCEELYIVDFSYPERIINELLKKFKTITILDHHKTAKEMLEPLIGTKSQLEIIFDMDRSGALITWDHLFPGQEAPALIRHISDRDLWKFEMDRTKEVHKALVSYPMDFGLWDTFEVERLKMEGVTCNRLYDNLVKNICKAFWIGEIAGHKVPMVNTSIAWSEVGHQLLTDSPEADFVASFTVFDTQVMWSLRSKGEFDVSAIAKKFGGGGHLNAAGFKTARY